MEDAILSMRTNELDIGVWLMHTRGDARAVLKMDEVLTAHAPKTVADIEAIMKETL